MRGAFGRSRSILEEIFQDRFARGEELIEQCLRDHEADLATDDLGLETCEGKKLLKAGALAKLELGLKSGPKLLFLLVTGMKRKLLHELPEHVTTAETAPWPEK